MLFIKGAHLITMCSFKLVDKYKKCVSINALSTLLTSEASASHSYFC